MTGHQCTRCGCDAGRAEKAFRFLLTAAIVTVLAAVGLVCAAGLGRLAAWIAP